MVPSTTIFTVPGNLQAFVNVSSISMDSSSSSVLSSDAISSVSQSSNSQGEAPEDLKIPEAAAWVSVGELREAAGLFRPRELRAIRMWDGLVLIEVCGTDTSHSHIYILFPLSFFLRFSSLLTPSSLAFG